jgi:hypothetical protein
MITEVVVVNSNDENEQFYCNVTGSLIHRPYHTLYPGEPDWNLIVDQIDAPFTFNSIYLFSIIEE